MTITYPNGRVLNAIVRSHEEHEIRAAAAGCDDVLVFTRVQGAWISQELEPVTCKFAWQRPEVAKEYSEDDFICPKELADRLLLLLAGDEPGLADGDTTELLPN